MSHFVQGKQEDKDRKMKSGNNGQEEGSERGKTRKQVGVNIIFFILFHTFLYQRMPKTKIPCPKKEAPPLDKAMQHPDKEEGCLSTKEKSLYSQLHMSLQIHVLNPCGMSG